MIASEVREVARKEEQERRVRVYLARSKAITDSCQHETVAHECLRAGARSCSSDERTDGRGEEVPFCYFGSVLDQNRR